ncbi:MAG: hypothetical protein ACE5GK_02110 [Nitrospiria bacterium]
MLRVLKPLGSSFEEKPIDFEILDIKIVRAIQSTKKIQREVRHRKETKVALQKTRDA